MDDNSLPPDWDDNPEWTEEDFARARPASEVHPPHIVRQLVRRSTLSLPTRWVRQDPFARQPQLGTLLAA